MHHNLLSIVSSTPPNWLITPFVILLLSIATGPLFFPKIWHHYYKHIAVAIGLIVSTYYITALSGTSLVLETFAEYVSFISLLIALYVCAGGIYIFLDRESTARNNIIFLLIGAILTNIIGTTGASILLIRPYMRMNRYRLRAYHIVFFILFISNLGGLLTPIGDPPLFMGFLKGVPFFWTTQHLWPMWLTAMVLLSVVFYWYEKQNTQFDEVDVSTHYTNRIIISGSKNFIWLAIIIITVFLDPNVIDGMPHLLIHGKKVSYIRELIQLTIAWLAYKTANKKALETNKFDFEPIKEVGFLFFGIFLAMIPALQLLDAAGRGGTHLSAHVLYWFTGLFSSVLDNAPTYINFFALTLSNNNLSIANYADVQSFVQSENALLLEAISVAAVFFGALTYIGNGPNFMVKAIAEQTGVKMPGFFAYIIKYAAVILLPILLLIWFLFFVM